MLEKECLSEKECCSEKEMQLEVIMGRAGPRPKNFAHWSGQAGPKNFGSKLAGFCGPKNRLKSRFWLAQIPSRAKKNTDGPGPTRGPKNSAQNPAQKRAEPK